jgi:hypothetical protein
MHQNRDFGITHIKARKDHRCYGMGLGIMICDEAYPGFPGDVRNASAWPFPVQYEVVKGVDLQALVWAKDKTPCLEPIRQAALNLEKMGCRAIAAECGYYAWFQKEISEAVSVPCFLSSLLQVPMAQQVVGANKVVGVLVALKKQLQEKHLTSVGIVPGSDYVVEGAEDGGCCAEFDHLWVKSLQTDPPGAFYEKTEKEFVKVAVDFYHANPKMGAMVLECTGMQPFARAIQREIDIPIFSWGTLLEYAWSVAVHRDYYGHV